MTSFTSTTIASLTNILEARFPTNPVRSSIRQDLNSGIERGWSVEDTCGYFNKNYGISISAQEIISATTPVGSKIADLAIGPLGELPTNNKGSIVGSIKELIREINNLKNEINSHDIRINNLASQNTNQASIINTLTNKLNQQAIEMAILKEKDTQITQDFSNLKHILCTHIDSNIEVIGVVEPGTDGLNLVHN